jgi:hypothetical protein
MAEVKGGGVEPDHMYLINDICSFKHDDPIAALNFLEKFIYLQNKQRLHCACY